MRVGPLIASFVVIGILAFLGFNRNSTITPYLPSALNDKGLHFVGFSSLTFVVYWIWKRSIIKNSILTLTIMLLLSVISEVVQGMLPIDRAFDPHDIVANILGSFTGWTVAMVLDYLRRRFLINDYNRQRRDQEETVPLQVVREIRLDDISV
jgi:VanZ family protein